MKLPWNEQMFLNGTFVSLALLVGTPLSSVAFFVFIALYVFLILSRKNKIILPTYKQTPVYWFLFLFVTSEVVSLFYSSQIGFGMSQFEKLIPFILLLVIGFLYYSFQPLSFDLGVRFFVIGMSVLICVSVIVILYQFYFGHLQGQILYNGISNIDYFSVVGHRTYIGFLVLLTYPYLFSRFSNSRVFKIKLVYLGLILIFSYLIFLSGSRGVLIALILILSYLVVTEFVGRLKKYQIISGLLVIAGLGVTVILLSPRFNMVVEALTSGNMAASKEPRISSWLAAIQVIKEHPLLGWGLGDGKQQLLVMYQEMGFGLGAKNQLNAHNQFLESWIAAGVIPVIGIIGLLISMFFLPSHKKKYAIVFTLSCGVNLFFESMWVRNIGVVPCAFWIFLLHNTKGKISSEVRGWESRFFVYILIGLTIAIGWLMISAAQISFKSNNPNTYLQVPFTTEPTILPNNLSAAEVCINLNKVPMVGISEGEFYTFPFLKTNENINCTVGADVWVYVPEDSNLGRVWLYVYNYRNESYTVDYDLNHKGAWQHLELENKSLDKSFEIGLRVDFYDINLANCDGDKGMIYLALPNYEVNH